MATYEEKREKVIYSDDCDIFAAREVAFDWHGGQGSALYSFASTDCTVHSEEHRASLIADIESAIAKVKAKPDYYYSSWADVDSFTRENFQSGTPESEWGEPFEAGLDSLDNLLRVVKALPAKEG